MSGFMDTTAKENKMKHTIKLEVVLQMDEMDGTSEQSAEIAMELVREAIATAWDNTAEVSVLSHE